MNLELGERLHCTWQEKDASFDGKISNTGKTIELVLESNHSCQGVPGLNSSSTFRLDQIHIHYSNQTGQGSEHTINGHTAALEMHFVHIDNKYASLQEAAGHTDSIMVAALLFNEAQESMTNSELTKIATVAGTTLGKPGEELPISLSAKKLIAGSGLGQKIERFMTYQGSLTTPTCNEVVTWVIAAEKGVIGHNSMHLFRTAQGKDQTSLAPNFRQTHPLNGHRVTSSFLISQNIWS